MKWGSHEEIAPGLYITDAEPPPVLLVGQLHAILWPMERADHMRMTPKEVWEECLKEVQRLKGNQRES